MADLDQKSRDRRRNRNVDNLQLTDEERKVLRECRMNSMIRGVPAGVLAALLTSFAVKSGRFPHLIYWSRFYYGASFTGGLLFGVASYRKTCLEKIMKLENSALADQVRDYFKRSGIEYTGPQSQKKDTGFDESEVSSYIPSGESNSTLARESSSYSSRSSDEETNLNSLNNWQGDKQEEPKHSFEERRKQSRQKWHQSNYPIRSNQKLDSRKEDNQVHENDQDRDHHIPSTSEDRQTQGSSGIIRRNKYGDPLE